VLRLPPTERPVEAEWLGVVAQPVEVERPVEAVRGFNVVRLAEDARLVELLRPVEVEWLTGVDLGLEVPRDVGRLMGERRSGPALGPRW
jgi:hypothetical protein